MEKTLGRRRASFALLAVALAATLGACEIGFDPTPGPTTPDGRDGLEEYCARQTAPDPDCWTSHFGSNVEAANDALEAVDVGPGGLAAFTATPHGLGTAAPVDITTASMVQNVHGIRLTQVLGYGDSCTILFDPDMLMGAALDAEGYVQAYIIGNPVVTTPEMVRIGSWLGDVEREYDVALNNTQIGPVAVADFPDAAAGLGRSEAGRAIRFHLTGEGQVAFWIVGSTSWVLNIELCP